MAGEGCTIGVARSNALLLELEADIHAAMDGYEGTWSAALIDLGCETELHVNPDYTQYVASSSKIVVVIAVLRAIEQERITFEDVSEMIDEVMWHSADWAADALNDLLEPEEILEVLDHSGVSAQTSFPYHWRAAIMPALDLARVWAALLDGRLLDPDYTRYLLEQASRADIPAGLETFPLAGEVEGYAYGQKAGYYVSDGVPFFLVGAGYVRAEGSGHPGFAVVWIGRTTNGDLLDPQRRAVFPLMLDYIDASLADSPG